jgi:serine kinase of HPr protein (carbohydrate metabolism regulator)
VIETVHASCVAIGGRGVLLRGRSGSGKSDLALRLIDRGAALVSDDYTILSTGGGGVTASAPGTIEGKIELRGVGILALPFERDVAVCLVADLDRAPERLSEAECGAELLGASIPAIGLSALEASAPLKVEQALLRFGLPLP